jgi:hypothetical protein
MLRYLVLALVLSLAACGQQPQAEEKQTASATAAHNASRPSIGPAGAAGISTPLPMSVEAVRAAAAGLTATEVQDQIEGQSFTAIALSSGNEEIFRIYPTSDGANIHAISTKSPNVRGPTEDIVGVTTFAVAPVDDVRFCLAELVEGQAGFACSTAENGRFWRIYRLPEGAEPETSFEEIEPDLLHEATLAEMRWIAPRVTVASN